jgi:hypothetical protein
MSEMILERFRMRLAAWVLGCDTVDRMVDAEIVYRNGPKDAVQPGDLRAGLEIAIDSVSMYLDLLPPESAVQIFEGEDLSPAFQKYRKGIVLRLYQLSAHCRDQRDFHE